jgi:RNA polymerase sigma factor (sigma-70 family)
MDSVQMPDSGLDLSRETDEDLLVYMTMRGDDPSASEEAWAEFYRRHRGYLYGVCCRLTHGVMDTSGASDIVQDTFIRVFEKAGTFDGGGMTDPEVLRRRARKWLGRIAHNIFIDILRGRDGATEEPIDEQSLGGEPEKDQASVAASAERELLDEAIDSLSERKQLVLRTTFQYYQPGKKNQRLPNHVAEGLAKTLKTTSDNIRQLRHRALQDINRYIKAKTGSKTK